MDTVVIKVYKDQSGVYPNGREQPISKASAVLGTGWISLVNPHDMRIDSTAPSIFALKLSVPGAGEVYTDLTEQGWYNLLNGVGSGGGTGEKTRMVEWTIGVNGDIPAGTTVIRPELFGATILDIQLDNALINEIGQANFFDNNFGVNLGKLDFAVKAMVLVDNDPAKLSVLKIIYNEP